MTAIAIAALILLTAPQQTRDVTRTGGASLSGTLVSDEASPRPIRHALVELSGDRALSVVTGDDGVFDFSGLPAGRYVLAASTLAMGPRRYSANLNATEPTPIVLAPNQQLGGLQFVFRAGVVISGRIKDVAGVPIEHAIVSAIVPADSTSQAPGVAAEAETDDEGNYRLFGLAPGAYILSASSGSAAPRDADALTPVETFFPGVEAPASAQVIDLAPRDERFGVDIAMRRAKSGVIAGTLMNTAGEMVDATVRLSRPGPLNDSRTVSVRGGAFSVAVAPGAYTLRASHKRTVESDGATRTVFDAVVATVEVIEGSRVDLPMVLHAPVTLSGQITVSRPGTSTPQLAVAFNGETTRAIIREDGRFVFAELPPGEYQLQSVAGSGWLVESATLGGRDALQSPIAVASLPIDGLAVSLTNRAGGVAGRLSHSTGAGAPELAIVVVNTNSAVWESANGRPLVIWPDTNGDWSATLLPEGEYRVAALSDVSAADLAREDFLASIVAAGTAVSVSASATATLNLQIK